jgi:type IV pilus assembly protein PilE
VAGIAIAVVAGGFFVVMMIGIVAALAIPRFSQASTRAKEKEGELLLRQLFTLEQAYRADQGAFTRDLADLAKVGWETPQTRYYDVAVSNDGELSLCLEAVPKAAATSQVGALSMDAEGVLHHGSGCHGPSSYPVHEEGAEPVTQAESDAPGPSGDEGARQLLRDVYAGVIEFRDRHGSRPATLAPALDHVHDSRGAAENSLDYEPRAHGFCISVFPRPEAAGTHAYSADETGRMFEGRGCSGPAAGRADAGGEPAAAAPAKDSKRAGEEASKP